MGLIVDIKVMTFSSRDLNTALQFFEKQGGEETCKLLRNWINECITSKKSTIDIPINGDARLLECFEIIQEVIDFAKADEMSRVVEQRVNSVPTSQKLRVAIKECSRLSSG